MRLILCEKQFLYLNAGAHANTEMPTYLSLFGVICYVFTVAIQSRILLRYYWLLLTSCL